MPKLTPPTNPRVLLALWALSSSFVVGCSAAPKGQQARTGAAEEAQRLVAQEREQFDRGVQLAQQAERVLARGDSDRAIELFTQATAAYPDLAPAWNNLGILLMHRKDYALAEDAFNAAARADLLDGRPHMNRGILYMNRSYIREARDAFNLALERDDSLLGALWGSVRADVDLGTESRATLERIRALTFRTSDEQATQWLLRQRLRIESKLQGPSAGSTPSTPSPSPAEQDLPRLTDPAAEPIDLPSGNAPRS